MPEEVEQFTAALASLGASEALRRVEERRQKLTDEAAAVASLRLAVMVRCQDEDDLTAAEIAAVLGLPVADREERDTSAARVRQWLLEGRKLTGIPSRRRSGRPARYDDLLTHDRILADLLAGQSFADIAKTANVGGPTVARYAARLGIDCTQMRAAETATAAGALKRFARAKEPSLRAAVARNPHLPADLRDALARDEHPIVAEQARQPALASS